MTKILILDSNFLSSLSLISQANSNFSFVIYLNNLDYAGNIFLWLVIRKSDLLWPWSLGNSWWMQTAAFPARVNGLVKFPNSDESDSRRWLGGRQAKYFSISFSAIVPCKLLSWTLILSLQVSHQRETYKTRWSWKFPKQLSTFNSSYISVLLDI